VPHLFGTECAVAVQVAAAEPVDNITPTAAHDALNTAQCKSYMLNLAQHTLTV
jgi:hypothetical protein